jgi:hypothetical protein
MWHRIHSQPFSGSYQLNSFGFGMLSIAIPAS